jgi:hypothetical protein
MRGTDNAEVAAVQGSDGGGAVPLGDRDDDCVCGAQAADGRVLPALDTLLDDYNRAFRDGGVPAGAALLRDAPRPTGDSGVDAAIAALAEYLARRDGWRPPSWAFEQTRYAEPWWFVSGVRAWHAIALVESPLAFRKRGVFLTASALERV